MNKFLLAIFSFSIATLSGQGNINLTSLDTIHVEVSNNNDILYIHKIKKSETIYSLAKFFKVSVASLMTDNNISYGQTIALDSEIKIKINAGFIEKSSVKKHNSWIPIIYQVQKKETLYRIAKGYFDQDIQLLMGRNQLSKFTLGLGQELIVGWWPSSDPSSSIAPENKLQVSLTDSSTKKQNDLKELDLKFESSVHKPIMTPSDTLPAITFEEDSFKIDSSVLNYTIHELNDSVIITSLKGIAIWDKSDTNDDYLFVMHKSAKVGSLIKLQHPVTKIIVVAEVVDNLPEGVYPPDVDLLISKAVAQQLGARETRFQLAMTYYE